MRYECHVTVERFPTLEKIVRFQHWCIQNSAKALLIELSRGTVCKLQLMAAITTTLDNDTLALDWADSIVAKIQDAGFHIIRVKLESELHPGAAEYYEAHWKLAPKYKEQFPGGLMHLLCSWNLINGAAYISERYDAVGQSVQTVQTNFDSTGDFLKMVGYEYDKVHYERVLYDSNRQLDAGWQGA